MRSKFGFAVLTWIVVGGCSLSSHKTSTDTAMIDAGDASTGPATVIVGALTTDQDCVVTSDAPFLLTGLVDVTSTNGCNASYNLALLINNFVPASDVPDGFVGISLEGVQVTAADVSLRDLNGSLLDTGTLPNPFSVTTFGSISPARGGEPGAGIVLVETIPNAYRSVLSDLGAAHRRVIAEITLTATTVGGMHVDPETFRFPIELCVGCLHRCESELTPEEIDALSAGQCLDNAGADGRICFDSSC